MQSCILTIIKNEQEYLDEWIQYHLNLGINHIFIFEDIDSESHKNITNKYSNVSLNSILSILNDEQKNEAYELKQTKKYNVQNLYFKQGLNYIKENYKFNWCFIIDIDEFITLEHNINTLDDILVLYNNYDAFIMSWECYGANNHIEKPNYNESGVIEQYPNKMKGFLSNPPQFHTKTCYNMNTYTDSFYKDNHQPSNDCNWCRTDFSPDRNIKNYRNIYIRHYITKSWEEYIDKKYNRGYFVGKSRTIDFFFMINPELHYIKEKLINRLNKKILIVLPYIQNKSQGNELRIALKCWKKFCSFNYQFMVIGEFEDTLQKEFNWVKFIYLKKKENIQGQYNPHLDIMNKFKYILDRYKNKFDGFIYTTDDYYAIKKFTLEDIMKIYYHELSFSGVESLPTSFWKYDKYKTRQILDKYNLPHINYTSHFPYYMEFDKLEEIINKFNMLNESYVFDDIYFNYFEHEQPILDSTIRLGIWSYDIYKKNCKNALDNPNIKFICNSVEGWSKDLEDSLEKILGDI